MKNQRQINIDRNIRNKRYSAYISRSLAMPFDEKLKKEGKTFTNWLNDNMEKYMKKN